MASNQRRSRIGIRFTQGDIWLLGTDKRYQLGEGLSIQLRENQIWPGVAAFSYDGHFLVEYAAQLPLDVAAGLLSAWLYDKLKRNKATITIDRTKVEVDDKGKLTKLLREHIEKRGAATEEPRRGKAPSKKSKPRRAPVKKSKPRETPSPKPKRKPSTKRI